MDSDVELSPARTPRNRADPYGGGSIDDIEVEICSRVQPSANPVGMSPGGFLSLHFSACVIDRPVCPVHSALESQDTAVDSAPARKFNRMSSLLLLWI
jgi:hypothetical protein